MGSSRLPGGVAVVALVALLTMSATIGAHTDEMLTDPEGDPQLSVLPPLIGASCPRTDLLQAEFNAFHNRTDSEGELVNGTDIVLHIDDITHHCPTETDDRDLFTYRLVLEPANPDIEYVEIRNEMTDDAQVHMQIIRVEGTEPYDRAYQSCGGEHCFDIDQDASTISFNIPTDVIEPPWTNVRVTSQMWTCIQGDCTRGFVSQFGDRMPDRGGATLFDESS